MPEPGGPKREDDANSAIGRRGVDTGASPKAGTVGARPVPSKGTDSVRQLSHDCRPNRMPDPGAGPAPTRTVDRPADDPRPATRSVASNDVS